MAYPVNNGAGPHAAQAAALLAQMTKPPMKTRKIVMDDVVTVRGEILRPQMAITMQRSKLNFGTLRPKESFLQRIIRSVSDGSLR